MSSRHPVAVLTWLLFLLPASAQESRRLTVAANVTDAPEPLTTARVWTLDPRELNPHRAHWIVERKVGLRGLKPVPAGAGFTVRGTAIVSDAKIHVRTPGFPYEQYPCAKEPPGGSVKSWDSGNWYWNADGARVAGKTAASAWSRILEDRRAKLELMLSKVSAPTQAAASEAGRVAVLRWLRDVESEWQVKAQLEGRAAEWKHYFRSAVEQGWCTAEGRPRLPSRNPGGGREMKPVFREVPPAPPIEKQLEPVPASRGQLPLLARLPAQRWNGLFSVRASMEAAGHIVNGHFLLDSGAAVSMVSPEFLKRQGVNPSLIESRGLPLQRVSWSGGSGLARWVEVFDLKVGVQPLGFSQLILMETELFAPPETKGSCCDGILGADFLRRFAVEFVTYPDPMVLVYPREGFSRWTDAGSEKRPWPWVELNSTPSGEVTSDCSLLPQRIGGVRWDTGSEWGISVHTPWAAESKREGIASWEMRCGNQLVIADRIAPAAVSLVTARATRGVADGPFEKKDPGFTAGMELLGRAGFIFDLGNGRLWLHPEALTRPIPVNRTGLTVKYIYNERDERELRVTQVVPTDANEAARKAGLKAGTPVVKLDGIDPKTLDLWDAEQRLSGVFGASVKIEFPGPANAKGEESPEIAAAIVPVR